MKKLLVIGLVVLLSFSYSVRAQAPRGPMPGLPFTSGCALSSDYDCVVNFVLYWLGFPLTQQNTKPFGFPFKVNVPGRQDYFNTGTRGPQGLLMEILIPVIALTLITWGFMSQLRIFRGKDWINAVLSFMMVIISATIGVFRWIVALVFMIGPIYSFGIWAILFFMGVWFTFIRARAGMESEARVVNVKLQGLKVKERELREQRAALADLYEELAMETNPERRDRIIGNINNLKRRIERTKAEKEDQENV